MQATLLLIAALVCGAHALRVPFDPSLVNQTHEVSMQPCYYPRAPSSSLTLRPRSLTYVPRIINDKGGALYTGQWFCRGQVDLHYRRRPRHVWLEVLPVATTPFIDGPNGTPITAGDAICRRLQTRRVYWPWGPSRPGFVAEFTKLYNATKAMKAASLKCRRKNGPIDTVIAYLHTVAFDYYIPLVV